VCLAALLLGSLPAAAADGVWEIDAGCVDIGCFPGDGAGFPVQIMGPGSYKLTGNLDTRAAGDVDAIRIQAKAVTLDLAGFSIIGGVSCSGPPVSCASSANGAGVRVVDVGATIKNGAINGFGNGIDSSREYTRVQDLVVSSNSGTGISAGSAGSQILNATVFLNGGIGIAIANAGMVRRSTSYGNGTAGIATGESCLLIDNSIFKNGLWGILSNGKSLFARNVIAGSGSEGVRDQGGGSLAFGNALANNPIALISLVPTSAFTENTLTASGGTSFWLSLGQNACDGSSC
jgi:hypothetical protein